MTPEEQIREAIARDEQHALGVFRDWLGQADVELDEDGVKLAWASFYAGWVAQKTGTFKEAASSDIEAAARLVRRATTPRSVLLAEQRAKARSVVEG